MFRDGMDEELFLRLARQHHVVPLVHRALRDDDSIPRRVRDALAESWRIGLRRGMLLRSELASIARLFDKNGIQYLTYKGPSLALKLHDGISMRSFGDLDFLLSEECFDEAVHLLEANGYTRRFVHPDPDVEKRYMGERREANLVRTAGLVNLEVEIKRRLGDRQMPFPVDTQTLISTGSVVSIDGVDVRTVSPSHLPAVLSCHASRHIWMRLAWVCDIRDLLESQATMDWQEALKLCRDTGCLRQTLVGICLAQELLGVAVPAPVQDLLEADRHVVPLASQAKKAMFFDPPIGNYYAYHSFHTLSREKLMDRVRIWWFWLLDSSRLELMFRITDADRAVVSLPPWLSWAYYLVRVVRLTGRLLTNRS